MRSFKIFSRWRHILFSKSQFNNPKPNPIPNHKPNPKTNPKTNPNRMFENRQYSRRKLDVTRSQLIT